MKDLIKRLENIIGMPNTDNDEIIFQLKNLLHEVEFQKVNVKDSIPIMDLFSEVVSTMQGNDSESRVIKTGYKNLDHLIGGFLPGELIVIGGRPSMGKTQLLVNLTLKMAQNLPILYFSFDLSSFLLSNRLISAMSNIAVQNILQKNLSTEEKTIVKSLETELKNYKVFINDRCNNSISDFKAHCLKMIREKDVKVIIVDYLQMMGANKYRNNRELEISYISRELKTIAKDHNVCIIAASQLSRAVESRGFSKKPILSDLRDSGAIEQDADKVIFIYRPEYYGFQEDEEMNKTAGIVELMVAKNRNGSLGITKLMRDADFTTFSDFEHYITDFEFSQKRLDELGPPF
jgi:replicative DNA helicase